MLRGVIKLTIEEAKTAQEFVRKYLSGTSLESKIIAAINQSQTNVELQLSELEVEQLLDNMDAPTPDESERKKNLRRSLQTFMVKLKGL